MKPDGFFRDGEKKSWSRLMATIIIVAPLMWATFIVYEKGSIPELTGVISVIATGVGLYATNKFSTPNIIKAIDQTQNSTPPAT